MPKLFFSACLSGVDSPILLGISAKVKPLNGLCVKSDKEMHSFKLLKQIFYLSGCCLAYYSKMFKNNKFPHFTGLLEPGYHRACGENLY